MLQVLVNFIFYIIKTISNLIFTPILALLTAFFPDIGDLIASAQNFLTTYIFDVLRFIKSAFMHTTGFPQTLFTFIASYILLKIGLHVGMTTYRFILKMWERFKP